MDLALLTRLNALRRERRAAVVVTRLSDGATSGWSRTRTTSPTTRCAPNSAPRSGRARSGVIATEAGGLPRAEVPPPRIVVVGAVHISQAMVPICRTIGWDLTVIDPRTAFASPERFPGRAAARGLARERAARARARSLHGAGGRDPTTPRSTTSRSATRRAGLLLRGRPRKPEDPRQAARNACSAPVSRGRHRGHPRPIGLDIGAASPAEIAVAVVAEIIEAFRRRAVSGAAT